MSFSAADIVFPGGSGSVDAELRNADGRVLKVFQGNPLLQPGGVVTFSGLPMSTYSLYVRRSTVPTVGTEQTEFPWAGVPVDLVNNVNLPLGPILLSQPTMNLTGTLPKGGQVKLTAVPEDTWLRPSHVDGDQATPMAVNWTEQSEGGSYAVRGIVPGTYAAAVTTARKERGDKPTTTGANLAATHTTVIVSGPTPTAAFTAPKGAKVRGVMRYDRGNQPVIAPFGFRVFDPGDQSWLFPTVSQKQKYGKPFRVEMLHAGKAGGRLFDLEALYAEHPNVLIPDNLVSSARNDPGTPYWYTTRKQGIKLTEGGTVDLGVLKLKIHGVNGVRAVIGGGGREGYRAPRPDDVRTAAGRAGVEAEIARADLGAAEVLDVVEAGLGEQCHELGRLPPLAERLARSGDAGRQLEAARGLLIAVGGGVVEDHLGAGHGSDRAQGLGHGLAGQVGHHAEPHELGGRRGVEPDLDQPAHQVVALEVDADVGHRVRDFDPRLGEPLPLPRTGGREVDLVDAQPLAGRAAGRRTCPGRLRAPRPAAPRGPPPRPRRPRRTGAGPRRRTAAATAAVRRPGPPPGPHRGSARPAGPRRQRAGRGQRARRDGPPHRTRCGSARLHARAAAPTASMKASTSGCTGAPASAPTCGWNIEVT